MALSLSERIASALPKDIHLTVHHCSALPTSTTPLFVAAPGANPEATELESHFLSASIETSNGLVQVFAIEVLTYTTATLTTLFVSKADSTGYLHLLNAGSGDRSVSPIRTVITSFLIHLTEFKKQASSRLVLSLFARAQDQYLFPGSIENSGKHVLDDRGLIKWWARIVDGIFTHYSSPQVGSDVYQNQAGTHHVRGHLVVPGIDAHEAKTLLPRDADYKTSTFWQINDPLKTLGVPADVPERCLIPRFPDDPKARFAIDLDDELPAPLKGGEGAAAEQEQKGLSGRWRSVRSLAQFWELMSFRQECSAGRLVGFLWGIWEPEALVAKPFQATTRGEDRLSGAAQVPHVATLANGLPTPVSSQIARQEVPLPTMAQVASITDLIPPPVASSPKVSQQLAPQVQTPAKTQPSSIPESVPPPVDALETLTMPPLIKQTPSELVLSADAYARSMELLLTLDYCDLPTAVTSTKKLLDAIATEGGKETWGVEVIGTKVSDEAQEKTQAGKANNLVELVRKRPKAEVNTLLAGLVRKKPKN